MKSTKGKYLKIITESCQSRRKTSEVKRTFQESPEKSISEIINDQLDIKLRRFTEDELDTVLKTIKSRKAVGLDEILLKYV